MITFLTAGLMFAWPLRSLPVPIRTRLRLPRKVLIAAAVVMGCVIAFWAARTTITTSREIPAEPLSRLVGSGTAFRDQFSGQLYNGTVWTIREVTVEIVHKPAPSLPADFFDREHPEPNRAPDALDELLKTVPPAAKDAEGWHLLPDDAPASASSRSTGRTALSDTKRYRIQGLWIPPLETKPIQVSIMSPEDLKFDSWRIVSAKGFKNYW